MTTSGTTALRCCRAPANYWLSSLLRVTLAVSGCFAFADIGLQTLDGRIAMSGFAPSTTAPLALLAALGAAV
jgi:hypothetical protein